MKRTTSRIAFLALAASIGLGGLAADGPAHAATYQTGTCHTATSGGTSGMEHVITHEGGAIATVPAGSNMLVATTTRASGYTCIIDGTTFAVVSSAAASTGNFEVWNGGGSAAGGKFYRIINK